MSTKKEAREGNPGEYLINQCHKHNTKFAKPSQSEVKRCMSCFTYYLAAETQVICRACLCWSLISTSAHGVSTLRQEAA